MKIIHTPPVFQPLTIILEERREVEMLEQCCEYYAQNKALGPVEIAFYRDLAKALYEEKRR